MENFNRHSKNIAIHLDLNFFRCPFCNKTVSHSSPDEVYDEYGFFYNCVYCENMYVLGRIGGAKNDVKKKKYPDISDLEDDRTVSKHLDGLYFQCPHCKSTNEYNLKSNNIFDDYGLEITCDSCKQESYLGVGPNGKSTKDLTKEIERCNKHGKSKLFKL